MNCRRSNAGCFQKFCGAFEAFTEVKTGPVFNAETWQARLIATLLWSLMAAGFGGTGWVFGVRPIAVMIHSWQLAQDYREVDAKIVGSSVVLPDGNTHSVVAALYEVDGKPYHTSRLTLVDDSALDEPENVSFANSLGSLANTDAKTKVWVDPNDPAKAVVSRFITDEAILRRASLAIAFTILSLVGLVAAIGAWGNFGYYRRFDNHKRAWIITVPLCAIVFSLRRLFIDPAVDRDNDFFEIAFILECGAGLFLFVAIKLLFERDSENAKNNGNQDASTPPARKKRVRKN